VRPDRVLIKHLYRTLGPKAAEIYNRLPLFVLPEDSEELIKHELKLLEIAPQELHLPFEDFLMDFPGGMKVDSGIEELDHMLAQRGGLWVRARILSVFEKDEATQIGPSHFKGLKKEDWFLLEVWEEHTTFGGPHPLPNHSLVSLHDFQDFGAYLHGLPCPVGAKDALWCNWNQCKDPKKWMCQGSYLMQVIQCRLVILSLLYLTEGLGGLVTEVKPVALTPKEIKTEKKKPWLAPRRRTYIIVDPARAGEYGHPSGAGIPKEKRRSPIPHPRRGHWRKLGDRRTWVRPTWVGATQWESEGRIYKIAGFPGPKH